MNTNHTCADKDEYVDSRVHGRDGHKLSDNVLAGHYESAPTPRAAWRVLVPILPSRNTAGSIKTRMSVRSVGAVFRGRDVADDVYYGRCFCIRMTFGDNDKKSPSW